MNSKSFTMSLSEESAQELAMLAERYNSQQKHPLNKLGLQDLLRLILKAHMQRLRGPTKVEKLRLNGFQAVSFRVGECPQCLLRVDKFDFPVLTLKQQGVVECQVCGWQGAEDDLG